MLAILVQLLSSNSTSPGMVHVVGYIIFIVQISESACILTSAPCMPLSNESLFSHKFEFIVYDREQKIDASYIFITDVHDLCLFTVCMDLRDLHHFQYLFHSASILYPLQFFVIDNLQLMN